VLGVVDAGAAAGFFGEPTEEVPAQNAMPTTTTPPTTAAATFTELLAMSRS
jgi:hypothetical protein